MTNDKLLLIRAGFFFYTFTKATANSDTTSTSRSETDIDLQGLLPSKLPFNVSEYMTRCAADLSINHGKLRSTNKCGSTYHPYVASKHSSDWISKLVGAYAYQKNGARHTSPKYNNPVANGFHPIFTILPPFKNIIVVRVDDLEWSQDRDAMSGTYLSIKDKNVVDILNEGCNFDVSYTCSGNNSDKKFQLQPDGRFKRIQ